MADLPDPLAVTHLDDYLRSQRPPTSELSKWPVRLLSRVTSVCVHQTAVPGGFGVKDFQIAAAMRERPDTTLDLLVQGLLWRYRKTPYHAVYSPRRRVSVVQWHPKWRTNHGNGSNRYSIGWAYDGGFTTHHTDVLDVVGGRESLTRVVETIRFATSKRTDSTATIEPTIPATRFGRASSSPSRRRWGWSCARPSPRDPARRSPRPGTADSRARTN